MTEAEASKLGLELMIPKQAAARLGVTVYMLRYWVSRAYVKKYYVYGGKSREYKVDWAEVEIQPELGYERKHTLYNLDWASIPKNAQGNRWVKKSEAGAGTGASDE